MNKIILNTGVQDFIKNYSNTDTLSVLLQKPLFEGIEQKELVEQLEARNKCQKKLPLWYGTPQIYYPNKLNIEQSSSEKTAAYKASLIDGNNLLDLTGGFGVDAYFFAEKMVHVTHCEIDKNLSEIAQHNFTVLGRDNITCIAEDGIAFLSTSQNNFDWIYVDPSRRNDVKGKVFLLQDCLPNLPEHLPLLFNRSKKIMVKTSPLLDLSIGIEDLKFVKEIHVVAIKNEVKELLFILESGFSGDILIKTINWTKDKAEKFNFSWKNETHAETEFALPEGYIYESNAAILKSGGFKSIAAKLGLKKLHPNSHLYTDSKLVDFPGRQFRIVETIPYGKKSLRKFANTKANITTRNFPSSVARLRKKHKIQDGGDTYLFFTTALDENLVVLECEKV